MENLKAILKVIRELKYVMTKRQIKNAIILCIIIFIGALLETLGVSAILPFIYALMAPEQLWSNSYINRITSFLNIKNDMGLIAIIALGIIVLYILKNAFLVLSAYIQACYKGEFVKTLSCHMLDSYMKRPYSFFLKINSADVIRGIISDVDSVNNMLVQIFVIITEILTALSITVYLMISDWIMAFGIVVIVSITFSVILLLVRKKMKTAGILAREAAALRYRYGQEAISGIKEITVRQRREHFVKKFECACEKKRKVDITLNFVSSLPTRIIEAVCVGGILIMVCVRVLLGVDITLFVPQLATFAVAAFKILPSIAKINGGINSIIFYKPCLHEIYDNLHEVNELREEMIVSLKDKQNEGIKFKNKVELKNIYMKYECEGVSILNGLNMSICKGDFIGIIGASGSGKTTLIDVLLGLLEPQEGNIYMDGIDIREIPLKWSKVIGYVPQNIYLIDDTIRNNIAFGVNDKEIDEYQIWKALEKAQLKEFVAGQKEGLDTLVGERGIRFSGGQVQRLGIARALYHEPDILVLDEATSALDNETEKAVMESIDNLKREKTLVVIAHRLTTIKEATKVYEIEKGIAINRSKYVGEEM